MPECVECGGSLAIADPVQGEIITCSDCGLDLEVTSLSPLALAAAPEEQEDWGE